eukprot:Unigene2713_Nuclearia_a/m.8397 Unigene2713_Nuclearia_a/g.8397  ORF Unigene2713_Nuclearia_a/g.8397 Unigene2713_Nuclearia_a/m.8397 type:complete len:388 (-) Unigene2713_Nuclearia_a:295-1458(-)
MTETHAAKPAYAGPAKGAELDLCFLLDATGSMGSYIASATRSIHNIVEKIKQAEHADVRFALVAYRDHPPQESTFVTQTYAFTGDVDEMTTYLSKISATGGGDGPEAVTAAMRVARDMPWRPNATKVAVIIADAPPHGLGESGDGFPNGDPDGHDPLQIARAMRQHGISIFVVACEPSVSSSYKFAIDFFRSIADITGGSLLPLTSAELLPPAIIGGAQEQMQLERLVADAEREADELRKRGVDKEEDIAKEEKRLQTNPSAEPRPQFTSSQATPHLFRPPPYLATQEPATVKSPDEIPPTSPGAGSSTPTAAKPATMPGVPAAAAVQRSSSSGVSVPVPGLPSRGSAMNFNFKVSDTMSKLSNNLLGRQQNTENAAFAGGIGDSDL